MKRVNGDQFSTVHELLCSLGAPYLQHEAIQAECPTGHVFVMSRGADKPKEAIERRIVNAGYCQGCKAFYHGDEGVLQRTVAA